MSPDTTWRPHPTHGKLTEAVAEKLPDSAFAFPKQRLLPLTDEGHVRAAIEGFGEVGDVTDEDRELAFKNIRRAAQFYNVPMTETDWRQLGTRHVEPGYKAVERDLR
ncbi:MAG: hypothetical protein Kow0056_07950 [Coriobacteriia bacterium]